MARVFVTGASERKMRYCPQCRKKIPPERRFENGVNCARCGFFRWDDFKKFKSLDGVPVPDSPQTKDSIKVMQPSDLDKLKPPKKGKANEQTEGGVASRPSTVRPSNRGSGKDKSTSNTSKSPRSSGVKPKDTDKQEPSEELRPDGDE